MAKKAVLAWYQSGTAFFVGVREIQPIQIRKYIVTE
jgi:hypothetical protein